MDSLTPIHPPFLRANGAMAAAIAGHDWGATPLGPISSWPPVLKIAVSTMINSAFPKCIGWGDELTTVYNDAFVPLLARKHPSLGQPLLEVWKETAHSIAPIAEAAMAGEPTFVEDFPIETDRNGTMETAYFTFCYSPICDENGDVKGMLNTVIETTSKVKAEALATLRNRELVHRSRNAYGLVSALVSQTVRGNRPAEEIRVELQKRIGALTRAQDMLMEDRSSLGTVETVARQALLPFDDVFQRIRLTGAEVVIGQDQVTTMSLALHELATNSIKYGALGVDGGAVDVSWEVAREETGPVLHFEWRESGGPAVTPPTSKGFGSRIIGEVLPRSFGGKVHVDYRPKGLVMTLDAPLGNPADGQTQVV
ncbi:sensor histidine kinase [Pseudoroseicyclus tamaricis]|uniref:histidine kinase n=1 Tax=Pseudoroseicyclus tamaricis TaxID=2705421 RepID=A0A6B2JW03_9RHOB|nr:PAS domain-containing sensor histidine kinase [Pseudoroseicyclus tamaricis]NDV00829.1 sensor histidine kinase [Pseudoroseicyclus tamaricis]